MKKLIYLYLTILSAMLIVCTVLLSLDSALTNASRSNVEYALTGIALFVVIALIIVAPKPSRS